MAMYGEMAMAVGPRIIQTALVFNKTGEEIVAATSTQMTHYESEIRRSEKTIADIAKRREIEPSEVLAAAEDERATSFYEAKAMTTAGGSTATNSAIRALQEDLQTLRGETTRIRNLRNLVRQLRLVSRNVAKSAVYPLHLSDLEQFGF